eukprot:TRINITY_DN3526_c0_g2_i2.p2 TRINITY_DN3526_c0_g2~~TRINITY_DN3526_c0_g2_i2.p2  ORF type:complete len:103 (-),score=1.37 TRINITY_DN3526_c0_g2_i2:58-366(-)
MKAISTWFRRGRGTALGVLVGGLVVGSALPHLIKGAASNLDKNVVVYTTSAISVVGGVVAILGRDGPFPFPKSEVDLRAVGIIFKNKAVLLATLGYFGHMCR